MTTLMADLRYAWRTLRQTPVFTMVAVLSIALGIGANAAIFTLVDQVLLRLLPVKDPARLVMLRGPSGDQHYGANYGSEHVVVSDVRGLPRSQRRLRRHVRPHALAVQIGSAAARSAPPASWSRAPTSRCSASARRPAGCSARRRSRAGRASAGGAQPRLLEQPLLARSRHHRPDAHRQQSAPHRRLASRRKGSPASTSATTIQLFVPMAMKAQMTPGYLCRTSTTGVRAGSSLRPAEAGRHRRTGGAARCSRYIRSIIEKEVKEPPFARASAYTKSQFLRTS